MTRYREILRLNSLGINHSQIAVSAGCSRQTVISVLKKIVVKGEMRKKIAQQMS